MGAKPLQVKFGKFRTVLVEFTTFCYATSITLRMRVKRDDDLSRTVLHTRDEHILLYYGYGYALRLNFILFFSFISCLIRRRHKLHRYRGFEYRVSISALNRKIFVNRLIEQNVD